MTDTPESCRITSTKTHGFQVTAYMVVARTQDQLQTVMPLANEIDADKYMLPKDKGGFPAELAEGETLVMVVVPEAGDSQPSLHIRNLDLSALRLLVKLSHDPQDPLVKWWTTELQVGSGGAFLKKQGFLCAQDGEMRACTYTVESCAWSDVETACMPQTSRRGVALPAPAVGGR